jgi:hypothetical protein
MILKTSEAERVSLLHDTAHLNGILAFLLKCSNILSIKSNHLYSDVILPQYQEWPFLNL